MGGQYNLEVRDFGPVAEARVEMRPLTVFIGPSNTGKSWLAILVYALYQCLGGNRLLFAARHRIPLFAPGREIPSEIVGSLEAWAANQSDDEQREGLPGRVAAHLRSRLEEASGLERALAEELGRCFGTSALKELVRRESRSSQATVNLEIPPQETPEAIRYQFSFGSGEPSVTGSLPLRSLRSSSRPLDPGLLGSPPDQPLEGPRRSGRRRIERIDFATFCPTSQAWSSSH